MLGCFLSLTDQLLHEKRGSQMNRLFSLMATAALVAILGVATPASASNTIHLRGDFSHYVSTTQLVYLVIFVDGHLVYIDCTTDDPTGCDEFNADEIVLVTGLAGYPNVCDTGEEIFYFNPIIPEVVKRCPADPEEHCVNLAD